MSAVEGEGREKRVSEEGMLEGEGHKEHGNSERGKGSVCTWGGSLEEEERVWVEGEIWEGEQLK